MCKGNAGWDTFERFFGQNRTPPEKSTSDLVVIFFAELIGTAIMVFIGCLGCTLVRFTNTEGGYSGPTNKSVGPFARSNVDDYFDKVNISNLVRMGNISALEATKGVPTGTLERPNLGLTTEQEASSSSIKSDLPIAVTDVTGSPSTDVLRLKRSNTDDPKVVSVRKDDLQKRDGGSVGAFRGKVDDKTDMPTLVPHINTTNKLSRSIDELRGNGTEGPMENSFEVSPIVGLSFGLGIMISTQIFAHISLGHFNPAVTLAAFVLCHIKLSYMLIYWAAQVLGSVLAAGLMFTLSSDKQYSTTWCLTKIIGLSTCQGFFIEFLLTLILILVYSAASDECHQDHQETWSIRYGLVTTGLVLAGTSFTMGSINPIRGLGPGLINLPFDTDYWIYWVAPFCAGLIGPLIYRGMFRDRHSTNSDWNLFWDCLRGKYSYK